MLSFNLTLSLVAITLLLAAVFDEGSANWCQGWMMSDCESCCEIKHSKTKSHWKRGSREKYCICCPYDYICARGDKLGG